MTNGESEDETDLEDTYGIDVEGSREQNIEQVSFEECVRIQEAGQVFRDGAAATPAGALDAVQDELDADSEEAHRLLALYLCIYTKRPDSASIQAVGVGRTFYQGRSVGELAAEMDRSAEEIKNDIREYIGSFVLSEEIDEVDLDQSLPDQPTNPYDDLIDELTFDAEEILPQRTLSEVAAASLELPPYRKMVEGLTIDMSYLATDIQVPALQQLVTEELRKPLLDAQPILDSLELTAGFEESLEHTFEVFREENLGLSDEAIANIAEAAQTSAEEWEDQDPFSEFDDLETDETVSREADERDKYEEEGVEAITHFSNVDQDTARAVYNQWWHATHTAVNETSAQISDVRLAVIAAVASLVMLYTGYINAGCVFIFQVLVHLGRINDD